MGGPPSINNLLLNLEVEAWRPPDVLFWDLIEARRARNSTVKDRTLRYVSKPPS